MRIKKDSKIGFSFKINEKLLGKIKIAETRFSNLKNEVDYSHH